MALFAVACVWASIGLGQTNLLPFPERTDYNLGFEAYPLAVADWDRDGDLDLAVPNRGGSTITVMSNDGHGLFTASATYEAGWLPAQVVAGDLNADSAPDMVVALASGSIAVMLNQGEGIFPSRADYSAGNVGFLDVSDLDGDGDLDIVAARYDAFCFSILLNDGSGNFLNGGAQADIERPIAVKARDLDGDGDNDLILSYCISNMMSVYLNDGNAQFLLAGIYGVGTYPIGIDAADLDADGDLDVTVANAGGSTIMVWFNNGSGTLESPQELYVGTGPWNLSIADPDEDGDLDILNTNCSTSSISIFFNDGQGLFPVRQDVATGAGPTSITAADLDGDGDLDLATANNWAPSACVTVLKSGLAPPTAEVLLQNLRQTVVVLNFKAGLSNALDAKLEHARDALLAANAGNRQDAANALDAFVNSVEAQRGKEISDKDADILITQVEGIRNRLNTI